LGRIGTDAAPAVPRLKELLAIERAAGGTGFSYATALCQIDPGQTEALDSLINVLRDKKARAMHWMVIQHLGEIGPNAKAAISELVECVAEGDEIVWPRAARALAQIGAPNAMFVPQLEGKLKSDNEQTRTEAIVVLLEIDPENRALQSAVVERLQNTSAYASKTVGLLERAGPAAKWAAPLLREKLKTNPGYSRKLIVEALRRIEPGVDPKSGEAKGKK
jgi:HEAT repeat protein